jgi:hypothetical protein
MMRMRVPALRDYLQQTMAEVVHTELKMLKSQDKLPVAPAGYERRCVWRIYVSRSLIAS